MRQSEFVAALLDPSFPMPTGLIRPDGQTATQRFSVYRNNVIAGLTAVLEAAFPVIRTLVGSEFFAAAAAVFVRAHPPKSRIMMLYGARFPDFLSAFEPAADYAYLPDVARLEQALRESSRHFANDAKPRPKIKPEQMQRVN